MVSCYFLKYTCLFCATDALLTVCVYCGTTLLFRASALPEIEILRPSFALLHTLKKGHSLTESSQTAHISEPAIFGDLMPYYHVIFASLCTVTLESVLSRLSLLNSCVILSAKVEQSSSRVAKIS